MAITNGGKLEPVNMDSLIKGWEYSQINSYRYFSLLKSVKYIAIHYTTSHKSDAGHWKLTISDWGTATRRGSADFIVDDGNIVQANKDLNSTTCYSVGADSRYNTKGGTLWGVVKNTNSTSIEICSTYTGSTSNPDANDPGWTYTINSLNNALRLTLALMNKYNIGVDHVIRHYDVTGKLCPGIVGWNADSGDESCWLNFKLHLTNKTLYATDEIVNTSGTGTTIIGTGSTTDASSTSSGSSDALLMEIENATPRTYAGIGENAYIADDTPESVLEALDIYEAELWTGVTDVLNGPASTITSVNSYWSHTLLAYYECPDIVDNNSELKSTDVSEIAEDASKESANALADSDTNASNIKVEESEKEEKLPRRMLVENNADAIILEEISIPAGDETDAGNAAKNTAYLSPIIKIGDVIYSNTIMGGENRNSILYFEISTKGKIPKLILTLRYLLKGSGEADLIKQGDNISVFYLAANDNIKSYRGDYHVMSVKRHMFGAAKETIDIVALLNIPNLYVSEPCNITGTSKEALREISKKLNLHWEFSDPENTNDALVWYCTPSTKDKDKTPMYIKYIDNIAKHAFKNKDSYFDWWIDPRYALVFSNMNYMLVEDGEDEDVKIALLLSNIQNDISLLKWLPSATWAKDKLTYMPLMLHNVIAETEASNTPFMIIEDNTKDALKFAYSGTSITENYSINNEGLEDDSNDISFNATICSNPYKLEHGWRLDLGGSEHDNSAINGSYSKLHKRRKISGLITTLSDGDAESLKTNNSNDGVSGATHKFYTVAQSHNELNLNYLYHKVVSFTLAGNNMQLVKGDTISVLFLDLANNAKTGYADKRIPDTLSLLDQQKCGTFMIKSVNTVYKPEWDGIKIASGWRTYVELVRREWPVPNYMENVNKEEENEKDEKQKLLIILNAMSLNKTTDEKWEDPNGITASYDTINLDDISASGLTIRTLKLYNEICQFGQMYNSYVKMVSGRRWASDENGNKVEGYPNIEENGCYKCINIKDEVIWVQEKNSRHFFGEAMDILNDGNTDFTRVLTLIIADDEVIAQMLDGGYFCTIETSVDDSGEKTKHYHIGTTRNKDIDAEELRKWWIKVVTHKGTSMKHNGKTYVFMNYAEYSQTDNLDGGEISGITAIASNKLLTLQTDATDVIVYVGNESDIDIIDTRIVDNDLEEYISVSYDKDNNYAIIKFLNGNRGDTKLPEDYEPGVDDFLSGYSLASCIHAITNEWKSLIVISENVDYGTAVSPTDEDNEEYWKASVNWTEVMSNAYKKLASIIEMHNAKTYVLIEFYTMPTPYIAANDENTDHTSLLGTIMEEYNGTDEYALASKLYVEWSEKYYYDPENDRIYNLDYVCPVDLDASDIKISWEAEDTASVAASTASYQTVDCDNAIDTASKYSGTGTSDPAINRSVFEDCLRRFSSTLGLTTLGFYVIFAQTMYESGEFKYFAEIGKGAGKKYGEATGNYNKVYYGRGPILVTWLANYTAIYEKFFKTHGLTEYDVVADPDLAETNPAIGSYLTIGWLASTRNGKNAILSANDGDLYKTTYYIVGSGATYEKRGEKLKKILPSDLNGLVKWKH